MFCNKCGKEINDEAVVCVHCGCAVNGNSVKKNNVPAGEDNVNVGLIICSILIPLVGVIVGIVNLCQKKTKSGGVYLGVGIAAWIVSAIILAVLGAL